MAQPGPEAERPWRTRPGETLGAGGGGVSPAGGVRPGRQRCLPLPCGGGDAAFRGLRGGWESGDCADVQNPARSQPLPEGLGAFTHPV